MGSKEDLIKKLKSRVQESDINELTKELARNMDKEIEELNMQPKNLLWARSVKELSSKTNENAEAYKLCNNKGILSNLLVEADKILEKEAQKENSNSINQARKYDEAIEVLSKESYSEDWAERLEKLNDEVKSSNIVVRSNMKNFNKLENLVKNIDKLKAQGIIENITLLSQNSKSLIWCDDVVELYNQVRRLPSKVRIAVNNLNVLEDLYDNVENYRSLINANKSLKQLANLTKLTPSKYNEVSDIITTVNSIDANSSLIDKTLFNKIVNLKNEYDNEKEIQQKEEKARLEKEKKEKKAIEDAKKAKEKAEKKRLMEEEANRKAIEAEQRRKEKEILQASVSISLSKIAKTKEGKTVKFGKYMQKNSSMEDIEWVVLKQEYGKALLMSVNILEAGISPTADYSDDDYKKYIINWSANAVRKWLNNQFFNIAFNEVEKEYVMEINHNTLYKNENKRDWGILNFNEQKSNIYSCNTTDKVFVLSTEDLDTYSKSLRKNRTAKATIHASQNGLFVTKKNGAWYTRDNFNVHNLTKDRYVYDMLFIDAKGEIYSKSCENPTQSNNLKNIGIRPVIWVKY